MKLTRKYLNFESRVFSWFCNRSFKGKEKDERHVLFVPLEEEVKGQMGASGK